jgi:hypothetical protein
MPCFSFCNNLYLNCKLWRSKYKARGDTSGGHYQLCESQEESETDTLLQEIDHPFDGDTHVIHYQDVTTANLSEDEDDIELFLDSRDT